MNKWDIRKLNFKKRLNQNSISKDLKGVEYLGLVKKENRS